MSKNKCCKTCKNFKDEDADGYGWCELQQEEVTGYFFHPCHEPLNNGWTEITPDNEEEVYDIPPERLVIANIINGLVYYSTYNDMSISIATMARYGGHYYYVLPELKIE